MDTVDEELLLNVVESMFRIYLWVRSFSHVRDLVAEKKKKKTQETKEKSLRKGLKAYDAPPRNAEVNVCTARLTLINECEVRSTCSLRILGATFKPILRFKTSLICCHVK